MHDGVDVSLKVLLESRRSLHRMITAPFNHVTALISVVPKCDGNIIRKRTLHFHTGSRSVRKSIHERNNMSHIHTEIFTIDCNKIYKYRTT